MYYCCLRFLLMQVHGAGFPAKRPSHSKLLVPETPLSQESLLPQNLHRSDISITPLLYPLKLPI